jgi:dihydrolipoamide dehydrogenase
LTKAGILACDVAIIGAGTAGLAAREAAEAAGSRVLLIDNGPGGTTCARVGCMPSKLLIAAGNAAQAMREGEAFGIEGGVARIDGPKVMERVRRERDRFVEGVMKKLRGFDPPTMRQATARFAAPGRLELDDGTTVEAKAIVIATGAASAIPKELATVKDRILTNETVFELEDIPQNLAVIGAGPLGLELAQAFARLGARVTVFNDTDSIGGLHDPEITAIARERFATELSFVLAIKLKDATPEANGIRLCWSDKNGADGDGVFSHVLAAAGRPPNLTSLNLKASGLALDGHGVPLFDPATARCGDSAVFIAGDARHDRSVLHEASAAGRLAGTNAACYPKLKSQPLGTALAITFTEPNIAAIGLTGRHLPKDCLTGTVRYNDQGRAKVENIPDGLLKVYAEVGSGRLLGAELACPAGEYLAHLLAWGIAAGWTVHDMLAKPFYHPTFEEGLRTALRDLCRQLQEEPREDFAFGAGC